MPTKVFLVHGWSANETTTYQALHIVLASHGYEVHEVYLGRYVSLDNEVEIRDIARAMHDELRRPHCLGEGPWETPFHIITHSTGALVVKHWIVHHYVGTHAEKKPLGSVVFLAGPHFGSRLAHHGRSMLAHARYRGDTGKRILEGLELGSAFSWQSNGEWLDPAHWQAKGTRPYCLIGDRVQRHLFGSRIFPAGFEKGSDMVVRVPAGNLNFARYAIDLSTGQSKKLGAIDGVPFGALAEYTHSGPNTGVMNSITTRATPEGHEALRLILRCLAVRRTAAEYDEVREELAAVTRQTRKTRQAFAQLDFRFRDVDGAPVEDYSFVLGAFVNNKRRPSQTIAHTHKNKVDGSYFTVFLNLKEFEPKLTYYMELTADTDTELVEYATPHEVPRFAGHELSGVVREDETTQIEVTLDRRPRRELFVFHHGNDPDLHIRWDRLGQPVKTKLPHK